MWASGGDRRLVSILGFAMDHHEINQNSLYLSDFLFKHISCKVIMQYILLF